MWNTSRGLGATVVRALAKVGLVWALAVLGALFMAMSSQGQESDHGYALSSAATHANASFSVSSGKDPHTLGLALALVVLAGGATVLAAGASRGDRDVQRRFVVEPDPTTDLPLALGLGLMA
jgi:hypothetical protein